MQEYDAVVIGSGHNGLVTALYLARAGWRVLVLERNPEIGGAIRSGEITRAGFIHDLYSTNQNLFVDSPVYQELKEDLARHNLHFITTETPVCNLYPDGSSIHVYKDYQRTLAAIRQHNPEDAAGWSHLYERYKPLMEAVLPLYYTPLPSLKALLILAKAVQMAGITRSVDMIQLLLNSTRELGDNFFASRELKALVACWGLHLDFGPDVVGGTLFPLSSAFGVMDRGINITRGGASHISQALAALIEEAGGSIRTGSEVRRIMTDGRRATGVELVNGERIEAARAVIANLTPTAVFKHLLDSAVVPRRVQRQANDYIYGPATMMIHLALSAPPQWIAGSEVGKFAYVHLGPYVEDLAQSYTDAMNGMLPASPLLIVGQTSAVDPSRAPGEGAVLYLQIRPLPGQIKGDALGEITAQDWATAKEPFAERVLQKLEHYAPGVRDLILDRVIYSPQDLAQHVPNWVDGDTISGSHHLSQNFLFRPFWGASRYRMPISNLYMVGAATWPGAGNNAGSGYLAAQRILKEQPEHWLRSSAIFAAVAGLFLILARLLRRLSSSR